MDITLAPVLLCDGLHVNLLFSPQGYNHKMTAAINKGATLKLWVIINRCCTNKFYV